MKQRVYLSTICLSILVLTLTQCSPPKPEPVKVGGIADNEFDPAEWGKVYPLHYESWLKTGEARPKGLSKYKKSWSNEKDIRDRLSEYPFSALLYNGWGFGIEYNEPRGHLHAIQDQINIDKKRTGPGGVCLACKTPYHKSFVKKFGMKYLTAKFNDALKMFPEKTRTLGPACIDCHSNKTMGLRVNKDHIARGLKMLHKDSFSHQELRTLACGQCHMTYYVPRNKKGKVAGDVMPPWTSSEWGNISIENIIKDLMTDFRRQEWTQKVTGFRMPYIRHPEFEFFSKNSVHWNAGLSCPDCHMPYQRVGAYKISDHNVTSPLKTKMKSCAQCHTESADWIKKQVLVIQDRTTSLLLRAGYQTAVVAKLFALANKAEKSGKTIEKSVYKKAKDYYMKAFLRVNFISAENSNGFHNPSEAGRILGDAIAFAGKAEVLLRYTLARGGVAVPESVHLELKKYLNSRGSKKLPFKEDQEVSDPYHTQKKIMSRDEMGL